MIFSAPFLSCSTMLPSHSLGQSRWNLQVIYDRIDWIWEGQVSDFLHYAGDIDGVYCFQTTTFALLLATCSNHHQSTAYLCGSTVDTLELFARLQQYYGSLIICVTMSL